MCQTCRIEKAIDYLLNERTCQYCKARITFGRAGKMYCNHTCKNRYHAQVKRIERDTNEKENSGLKRNFVVLSQQIDPEKQSMVLDRIDLDREGFNFDLHTGIKQNEYGIMRRIYGFTWFERPNNQIEVRYDNTKLKIPPLIYQRREIMARLVGR